MKTIKYLLVGALLLGFSAPSMAQDDAAITKATQIIKSTSPGAVEKALKDIVKANKKNPAVLVGIGKVLLDQKNVDLAMKYADMAMARDKKYAPAYILAGDIEVAKDDGGAAAGWYQQAKYFDPKNPEAYVKYANILRGRSPEEAVANLNELRTQRPDIAVDALAARIYYSANMLGKSMQAYEKVDRSKLEDVDITNYAMAGYLSQHRQKSLDMALYGLNKNPRNAAWNRLAFYNYTDEGKIEDALKYADRLFNASDSAKISGYDYTYYGQAYLANKQYDNAVDMYKKALAANADSKDLANSNRKSLSDAYLAKGDHANAISYYEEYLKNVKEPTATDLAGLGTIYTTVAASLKGEEQKATFRKADEVYKQLGEKFPANIDFANFLRARVNSNLDPDTKAGLAKPFYEALANSLSQKANRDNVDNTRLIEAYRYLGYYYLLKNEKSKADGYWKKVLELDPENATAKQALGMK